MFSMQLQIRNLTPISPSWGPLAPHQTITAQIGPLETQLVLGEEPSAGKNLLLDMSKQEVGELLCLYAFGLFMQNQRGKYWCILSLQHLQLGHSAHTRGLLFYNDHRQGCYQFDLVVKLTEYHPRVPAKTKQQAGPSLEHPPQVNQAKSFLHGYRALNNNQNGPSMKNKVLGHTQPMNALRVNPNIVQSEKAGYYLDDLGDDVYIPPVMQFTNTAVQPPIPAETLAKGQSSITPTMVITQPQGMPKLETIASYSQLQQQTQKKTVSKATTAANREKLRELAREEAQAEVGRRDNQIMIPVPNAQTGKYQLVPLSSMTEAQILDYAHKQKMAEQIQLWQQKDKQRQERKLKKKQKKQEVVGKMEKQARNQIGKQIIGHKYSHKQHISQKNEQSFSSGSESSEDKIPSGINANKVVGGSGLNGKNNSQENEDYDYESDFESISNAGSQLKSRLSLQSSMSMSQGREKKKPKNDEQLNESMNDYEYSQDFDSFSHSMLSKNKRASSISEISGSFASLSMRKP